MSITTLPPTLEFTVEVPSDIRVLVVEDSPDHQLLMRRRLVGAGMDVVTASDAAGALREVDGVDLVLLDYRLPGDSGLDVMRTIQDRPDPPSVIMVTGMGSTDVAVEAMRRGAVDYVTKEQGFLDDLPAVVRRAWRQHDLARRSTELQRLALLVSSATDRDELFEEIVSGALRLLHGSSAELLLADGERFETMTRLGDPPEGAVPILEPRLVADGTEPQHHGRRLVVPLPRDEGEAVGLLVVWGSDGGFVDDEVQLARAFAAFAGIALRNLRRRELERTLVAELQQTVDARRDFVASVSHELRTPLTCIAGFSRTLLDHWSELEPTVVVDLLGRLQRNTVDLRRLVDDLIDLSGLDRGQAFTVRPETLRADHCVEEVVADALELLSDRAVAVTVPAVEVTADPTLVRRILGNLLSNAMKYSVPGSPLVLRGVVDGALLRVEVEDRGMGMPPREAARVFDPFFRAQSSVTNAVRGSGIGLALVREYVRTMGGTVGVRSEPDVGSTFWFTLPLARVDVEVDAQVPVPD